MKALLLYSLLLFNFCILKGNVESIVGVVGDLWTDAQTDWTLSY